MILVVFNIKTQLIRITFQTRLEDGQKKNVCVFVRKKESKREDGRRDEGDAHGGGSEHERHWLWASPRIQRVRERERDGAFEPVKGMQQITVAIPDAVQNSTMLQQNNEFENCSVFHFINKNMPKPVIPAYRAKDNKSKPGFSSLLFQAFQVCIRVA